MGTIRRKVTAEKLADFLKVRLHRLTKRAQDQIAAFLNALPTLPEGVAWARS